MSNRPTPLVTGLSPKEGPPGTRITIRGENLGNEPKDLIGLIICSMDCLLSAEWKSPSKIVARTGPGKGKGDIIVITKSGGKGTCTVGFRGYFLQTGPLQESAVWIDESQTVQSTVSRGRTASPILFLDNENPLGISDEGRQNKFTEDILVELFPESSGKLSLENFNPAWFLVENHYSTSFDDLKAGLAHMKRRASHRSEGPIAFLKSNLTATLDCQDSLDSMYECFELDKIKDKSMNGYAVLLMQAKSCADGLFREVLGRKDKADSTRNALSVLQRFKFLFYLPLNIERNIQKGDYNLVINDYLRAKSLFGDTHVNVFRKVYAEVEKRISNFKEMLYKKLMELPNTLDQQKKLIKYLANLEANGDPALECLENQKAWLLKQLTGCRDTHINQENISRTEAENMASISSAQRRNLSGATSPGFQRQKLLSPPSFPKVPSFASNITSDTTGWKFQSPQRVLYVEALTDIMIENFPDLWKLCQAYFAGNLAQKDTGENAFKVDTSKHTAFKQNIVSMIRFFTNMIRAAFLPESIENLPSTEKMKLGAWPANKQGITGSWLPHSVRYIRSCVSSLSKLDLPGDSLEIINELAFDMRTTCMVTLLKQAIEEVRCLHTRETWVVETDDEFGGTTQLPALFENIVNEAIQHLHEVVVQIKTGEQDLFSQRPIQKETTGLCTKLLQAFSESLEKLAFSPDSNKHDSGNQGNQQGIVINIPSPEDPEETTLPRFDRRLIIMLSNCNHTAERVVPRLVENLNRHGYVEMAKTLKGAQDSYRTLDNKLFEAYVEEISNPIIGTMEQKMYQGQFDWNQCLKPRGVRSYLKEVIMGMIHVHSEVFSVSPSFLTRVLSRLTEAISEEISRLISCNTGFNPFGVLQAKLEINAFQEMIALYKTPAADASLKEALDALPKTKIIGPPEEKLLDDLLNTFKCQMKFQLTCFSNVTVMAVSSSSSVA